MLAHPVPPCRYLCCYRVPLTLTALPSWVTLPPLLRSVYLPLVKVCRLWVDSPFIQVKLVDLHWIPVIKIASGLIETSFVRCSESQAVNIVRGLSCCGSRFEIRLGPFTLIQVERDLTGIKLFGEMMESGVGLVFLPQYFVLPGQFVNLQVFSFDLFVCSFQLFSELFVSLQQLPDHINALNKSLGKLTVIVINLLWKPFLEHRHREVIFVWRVLISVRVVERISCSYGLVFIGGNTFCKGGVEWLICVVHLDWWIVLGGV